jgi:hypothetical protein
LKLHIGYNSTLKGKLKNSSTKKNENEKLIELKKLMKYIESLPNFESLLYKIDLNKIALAYEKELSSDYNSLVKINDFMKKRYYHLHDFNDNMQIFDSDLSVLLVSLLSGGFIGILIVACISIRSEISVEEKMKLYR